MERPAGVQVSGQSRPVPAGPLGDPGRGGRDDPRPVLGWARLTGPANRGRREPDDLVAAFAKRKLAEAALHLRPLVSIRRGQLVGVLIERLVEDGQEHERNAVAARRGFGKRLQQVDVAAGRLLRRVLQRLAGLVDDEQQACAGLVTDLLDRLLETSDDIGGRAPGEGRGRPVQQSLDGRQHPWLHSPLGRPDGFDRRP